MLPVYGGQGYGVQLSALRRGVHVIVGTPGRIMDHLEKGTLDLTELRFLVLDEADEMLNMGFAEDVETILADTPDDKQVALFSATMPAPIRRLSTKYLHDPVEITVKGKTATAANITQRYLLVSYPQKVDALTRILEVENFEGMIVFVRTKNETETLAEKLRARGFSATAINGDVAQNVRERTVNQLKSGQLDILVATDVAARGLDVERISHVVNYDIPTDTESYVHRIGRTGRAGRSGDAISFVTPRERYLLKHIEKATGTSAGPDARCPASRTSTRPDWPASTTRSPPRSRDRAGRLLPATWSRTTCTSTTCPRWTSPPRWPSCSRATSRCCSTRRRSGPPRWRAGSDPTGAATAAATAAARVARDGRPLATYRIAVGKRHKVEPRQIVGAIANEGGLRRQDFGAITIRPDFSLVELPADAVRRDLGRAALHPDLREADRPQEATTARRAAPRHAARPQAPAQEGLTVRPDGRR